MSNEVLAVIAIFLAVCLASTRHYVGAVFIVVMVMVGIMYGTIGQTGYRGGDVECEGGRVWRC
jgi:hypothetical protein